MYTDETDFEYPNEFDAEYGTWLDAIQAAQEADIAHEQYVHDIQEVAAMLAGGLI
jgi:hypothetical protein